MPNRSAEREQFLADIIISAIEGGTNDWACVHAYRWQDLPSSEVFAIIREDDDEHADALREAVASFMRESGDSRYPKVSQMLTHRMEDGTPILHEITIDVIATGINRICDGTVKVRMDLLQTLREANQENEAGDVDAEGASVIVQAALFGQVVYG